MNNSAFVRPQLVDGSAALRAGLIAGLLYLGIIGGIVPFFVGGNFWVIIRLLASIVLGPGVLAPPATFDPFILFIGLVVHFLLSIVFTLLLAWVTHRWGLITGIVLGGLFGWALYLINIYGMTLWFPWFAVMKHQAFLIAHSVFGMLAGGIYELLEMDDFVHAEKR